MMETLTATAIAKLVFDGAIQAGAGKITEAGLAQAQQLWQKILRKVKQEGVTETTFVEVETQKSFPIFEQQVVPFLHVAMVKDPQFAHEIQHIAQQINQEVIEGSKDNIQVTATSQDQSKQYVVGKAEADTQTFGDTYIGKK